jgi:putative transposase
MKEYITEAQFKLFSKYLFVKSKRPRKYDNFVVFNGILHILITGSQWRNLPNHYPPYRIVFYHFSRWKRLKLFHLILAQLNNKCNRKSLQRQEKQYQQNLLIIDNQSISDSDLPSKTFKGYDGHKKRKGRKRCVLVDTRGNLHCIKYFPANMSDVDTAEGILKYYRLTGYGKQNKQTVTIYGDKGFHSPRLEGILKAYNFKYRPLIRINKPDLDTKIGYALWKIQYGYLIDMIKKVRWVVERTFAWLQKYRRLNINYERTISSLEAMTILAGIRIWVRRIN